MDHDAHGMSAERGMQQLHIRKIRSLLTHEGDHPKMISTGDRVIEIVRQNERVVLFCDFLETGRELASHVGYRLREELPMKAAGRLPWKEAYRQACDFRVEGRPKNGHSKVFSLGSHPAGWPHKSVPGCKGSLGPHNISQTPF